MADEWDEDDFGTFESADASSPVVDSGRSSVTTANLNSNATPAWLLAAQHQNDDKKESPTKSLSEDSTMVEQTVEESNQQKNQNLSRSEAESSSNVFLSEGWQAFASVSEDSSIAFTHSSLHSPQEPPAAHKGDNVSHQTRANTLELKNIEVQVDNTSENEEILNLKGLLDNAVAMKAHTEASLEELQKEMEKVLSESKANQELIKREHQAEIERLKESQDNEIKLLKEESQKTMHMLTEKYASLAHQASIESNNERERSIEDVVEKCLDILQTQSSVLSDKVSRETNTQHEAITHLVESCRTELKEFVKSECDAVAVKCEEVKRETGDYLKSEIAKELECQRLIDEKCKREAMEELSRNLKTQLEETLKQEREKSAEAIKCAVLEARSSVKKAIEDDHKKSRNIREQHTLALQMLLTSSQEHLRHLTDIFCDNHQETS